MAVKRYIKRAAPVKAVQNDGLNFDELADFSGGQAFFQAGEVYVMISSDPVKVKFDDYLIKREDGSLGVLSREIFELEYEEWADPVERIRAIWKD